MSAVLNPKPKLSAPQVKMVMDAYREQKRTVDAFQNVLARTGFGTSNLLEATTNPLTRLSFNYILLQALYRNDWITRKVVDCIADDMTKNWIDIVSETPPDEIKQFDKVVDETGTEEQLTDALKWARLFGGAGAVIIIEGQNNLAKPLDLDSIQPDSYKGLLVFDRWSGITPGARVCTDIRNPLDFGLPESYRVTTEQSATFEVHHSRVLRFTGPKVPKWEFQVEQRWGISEIEVMYEELKKRNNTSWNIASLIFRANIFELKQKDLAGMLSGLTTSPAAAQKFQQILSAQNELMSNQGLFVTDPEGGLAQHSYSFAGLSEMYQQFMLDICGATGIPMSRLFGRSASGLSGTNEGDEHSYYDLIGQKQKRELAPQLRKLLPVIAMSTWGAVPEDFDWKFAAVRSMTSEQEADLTEKKSKPVIDAHNAGIISPRVALQELRQIGEETNSFTNITDEDVEAASDTPVGGEMPLEAMPGMEGAAPGEEMMDADFRSANKRLREISREYEKLSRRSSELTNKFIEEGRGNERPSDYRNKSDALSREAVEVAGKLYGLRLEAERIYGPGWHPGYEIRKTRDCHNSATDLTVDMPKHTHAEVKYEAESKNPKTICGRCIHFIPRENGKPACQIVVNPIHFNGWCEEFTENAATYRTTFQGLPIFIENRTGSVRKGNGWTRRMSNDYGYIENTVGVDGDHVDVFLGANVESPTAFVINALRPLTGKFDEQKVMLGFSNGEEARKAFLENYGFDEKFYGGQEAITVALLHERLYKRDEAGQKGTPIVN